jgi:FMN phosphatase YigB (HAD superfamily)
MLSVLGRQRQRDCTWVTFFTRPEPSRDVEALTREAMTVALNWNGGASVAVIGQLMGLYRTLPGFAEVPEMLAAHREVGLGTAILSNGSRAMLADAAAACGVRTVWVNRTSQPSEFAPHQVATMLGALSSLPGLFVGRDTAAP